MQGVDVYILDSLFLRSEVLSDYISLVWNEKFYEYGEFEMMLPYTERSINKVKTGTYIGTDFSDRVMKVHTVEQEEDEDGRKLIKVTGKSLEYILTGRIAWRDLLKLHTEKNEWVVSKTAYEHVNNMIWKALLGGTGDLTPVHPQDVIPNMRGDINLYPADNNTIPLTKITVSQANPTDVYSYLGDICKIYGVGFRIYRNRTNLDGGLIYNTYVGRDLTSSQTVLEPVIFSVAMDNIESIKFYESHDSWVSGVWVFSVNGVTSVFRTNTDNASFDGLGRIIKTMTVNEPDGMTSEEQADYREQLGMEELLATNPVFVLEGEISQTSQYRYHVNYELGDLIDLKSSNGFSSRMRVIEQVFTVTAEGFRSYPGLATEDTISVGHWAGYGAVEWAHASGTWQEQVTN